MEGEVKGARALGREGVEGSEKVEGRGNVIFRWGHSRRIRERYKGLKGNLV